MVSNAVASSPAIEPGSHRLLSRLELMNTLGIGKDLLIALLHDKQDPMPCLILGGLYKFRLADVLKWAERRTRRLSGDFRKRRSLAGLASWEARRPDRRPTKKAHA